MAYPKARSYQAIPDKVREVSVEVPQPPSVQNQNENKRQYRLAIIVTLVSTGIFILAGLWYLGRNTTALEGAAPEPQDVRFCTQNECRLQLISCDEDYRFMCVKTHWWYRIYPGACTSSPWENNHCREQCDTVSCHGEEFAASRPDMGSCKEVECPWEHCFPLHRYQRCGRTYPYQCIEGKLKWSCTDDEYKFNADDSGCSECCNTAKCPSWHSPIPSIR